jgi:hypothetical protein
MTWFRDDSEKKGGGKMNPSGTCTRVARVLSVGASMGPADFREVS